MKKLILSLLMVPLFAIALIGCGNGDTPAETNDPEVSEVDEGTDAEEETDDLDAGEEEEEEEQE